MSIYLTVRYSNTFKFVLLLDGVAVGGTLSSIDQLFSKTFGNTFSVTESGFTSPGCD